MLRAMKSLDMTLQEMIAMPLEKIGEFFIESRRKKHACRKRPVLKEDAKQLDPIMKADSKTRLRHIVNANGGLSHVMVPKTEINLDVILIQSTV